MKFLAILIGFCLLPTFAHAARADKRQNNQRQRIQQGVKSGELTKGEATRLRKQQRNIHRMENKAESDGTVTAKEKARIEKAQDRASKNIYRKKHNDRDRNSSDNSAETSTGASGETAQ